MMRIPFNFFAVAYELFCDDFINDPKMMRLIRYLLYIIRPYEQEVRIKSNGYHTIKLQAYEFYFGLEMCAIKTGMTLKEVRKRMDILRAGSSAGSFIEKRAGSRAGSFSIYRLCTENFSQNQGRQLGSQFSENEGRQLGTPLIYNNRNVDASFSLEKENVEKEKEEEITQYACYPEDMEEKPAEIVRYDFRASSLHREMEEHIEVLTAYCEEKNIDIPTLDFKKWIARYGKDRVLRTLLLMLKQKDVLTPVKWMQSALKRDYVGVEDTKDKNRAYAKEFKDKYNLFCLTLREDYCYWTDGRSRTDYQYFHQPEQFKRMLNDRLKIFRGVV